MRLAWRSDLRGLAAAVALDDTELDLRAALVLLALDSADAGDAARVEADVSELVAAAPEARALLHRAVHAWLVEL